MKYHNQYDPMPESAAIISEYFKGNEQIFTATLKYENFVWEANAINVAESILPEKLCMDLHLDMILNQGAGAVTRYYKTLLEGKNEILEKAKIKLRGANTKAIDESLAAFKKQIKKKLQSRLNEANVSPAALLDPTKALTDVLNSVSSKIPKEYKQKPTPSAENIEGATATDPEFDAALSGGEYTPSTESGESTGILMRLWNALTEDGSLIGIIHLILDIIGAFADFVVPGVGAIADVLNAIIYFIRGKYLLGTISLIAGVVFGAGDALKLLKPAAKSAEPVMMAIIKGGGKSGGEALAKLPAKESGPVLKLLRFIAKNIGSALGKGVQILGKFFDGFLSKAVGWIPFIGKPLKSFFDNIGATFAKYGQDMTKFSKEFGTAEKTAIGIAKKESAEGIETVIKGSGNSVVVDGGVAKIVDKSGNTISKEFPAEWLTKGMPPETLKMFSSPKVAAKYYSSIAKSNEKIAEGLGKWFLKKGVTAFKRTGQLSAFIGKEIIKIITGKSPQEAGYKEEEVEYWGNSAMQSWIEEKIKKEKEATGATYVPYVNLDSSEQEVFDRITKYQNTYADLFGHPHIIPVVYEKYGKTEDQFEDAWKAIGLGAGVEKKEEVKESFKYIIPFSKFI